MSSSEDGLQREQFGQLLYSHLFDGAVRDVWTKSIGRIQGVAEQGIRLRLWIDSSELAVLPWELLHDGVDFLAISGTIVVSRFMAAGEPSAFVTPEKARILVVIQEPSNKPILPDVLQQLKDALLASGRFSDPKVLRNSTLSEVNSELLKGYEALHYIGHGAPDKLLLASDKEVRIQDGREFAALFSGQPTLQLVVFNVCASGSTNSRGVFSGLGPFVSQKRIPAVVAMQYAAVAQLTAAEFNTAFYDALGKSLPIDVAVNTARRAIRLQNGNGRDWSTPVLYMTTRTGHVLEFVDSPDQAAARAAEMAKEQERREASHRETVVALGQAAEGLRFVAAELRDLEESERILAATRLLRNLLDTVPQPVSAAALNAWRQVQQPMKQLETHVQNLPSAQNWYPQTSRLASELPINVANANYGSAAKNLSEMRDALDTGIVQVESCIEAIVRRSETRVESVLASIKS
jgi:hypothetical protein